jgi:hypothetical protein
MTLSARNPTMVLHPGWISKKTVAHFNLVITEKQRKVIFLPIPRKGTKRRMSLVSPRVSCY